MQPLALFKPDITDFVLLGLFLGAVVLAVFGIRGAHARLTRPGKAGRFPPMSCNSCGEKDLPLAGQSVTVAGWVLFGLAALFALFGLFSGHFLLAGTALALSPWALWLTDFHPVCSRCRLRLDR